MDVNTETANETKAIIRSTWIDTAARVLFFVGIATAIATTVYFISGITQAGAGVDIVAVPTEDFRSGLQESLQQQLPDAAGTRVEDSSVSTLDLAIWDSTGSEQAFARLNVLLTGLAIFAVALLLGKILRSTAAGNPFAPGNVRRFQILAGIAFIHAIATMIISPVAAGSALTRAGLSDQFEPLAPVLDLFSVVVVPIGLLILGEAFRQGGQLRDDVEGLI